MFVVCSQRAGAGGFRAVQEGRARLVHHLTRGQLQHQQQRSSADPRHAWGRHSGHLGASHPPIPVHHVNCGWTWSDARIIYLPALLQRYWTMMILPRIFVPGQFAHTLW